MAKLPAVLPGWVSTVYRGDSIAWEDAKKQCRTVLHEWAAVKEARPYSDLSRRVTAIPWPDGPHTDEGSQMGFLLGQVSLAELDRLEDRPLISALVIEKDRNMPSHGFWNLCEELGLGIGPTAPMAAREAFWLLEVRRCFEAYGKGP